MNNILPPVKEALVALIKGFADGHSQISLSQAESFQNELIPLFTQIGDFPRKMNDLHVIIRNNPDFAVLEEYLFDLLMLNFIGSDSAKLDPDYLESEEWLKIEDDTADRGTELLNILLYITEAQQEDRTIDLADFLEEFLLTDDELYQDEYFIYEEVIRQAALADSSINEIVKAGKQVKADELKELFIPMMTFFNGVGSAESKYKALQEETYNRQVNLALLAALQAYHSSF